MPQDKNQNTPPTPEELLELVKTLSWQDFEKFHHQYLDYSKSKRSRHS